MALLCVVVPTLNEAENVEALISRLENALAGIDWEVIFVDDDSSDGTSDLVRRISTQKPHVRGIQRLGRRGLSSACMEGMMASAAPYLAVMDGDLQHDEGILVRMLEKLRGENLDLVVGSRNIDGGSMGALVGLRRLLSDFGRFLSRLVCRCEIQDPMSGFFVLDRRFLDISARRMSVTGFKILVDLISSSPRPVRLGEVAYRFRKRERGESKLESTVLVEYLFLIAEKLVGGFIPLRFVLFVFAGLGGALLHVGILGGLYVGRGVEFLTAQAIATITAMTLNFLLNNWLTFRDRRIRGWKLIAGLLSFYAACSIGALTNLALAQFLFARDIPWYLAGVLGVSVGSVWNFSVTSVFIWRSRKTTPRPAPAAVQSAVAVVETNLPRSQRTDRPAV